MDILDKKTFKKWSKYFPWGWFVLLIWAILLNLGDYEVPSILIYTLIGSAFFGLGVFIIHQNLILYTAKRLVEAFLTLFVILSLTFVLLRVVPGGPFDQDKALPPDIKANIERKYNLDQSLVTQYKNYLFRILKGDLGESYKYLGRSVSEIISESFPASFLLGFYSLFLAFLIGIPLGLLAASRHNQWVDNVSMIFAISGVSLPNFLVAAFLVQIFSMNMGWFPPAGWGAATYYVLPVLCLGMRPVAFIARLTRSSVLDVISSDYIRTAKSKGFAISGVSLPNFLVAAFLVQIFSMNMGWFPPAGWGAATYYVLPVLCLGMRPVAFIARLTRSSVLDVISSDYIRTAKSKGLSSKTIFKHMLIHYSF